ncbi:uncharacterized protein LOC130823414 [Amaranthus tricolor]|uniref:uncharacterized protein LOC130823414 n=1 Tax=Amaranthus tricolor TaxID=29722 RepID=UPI0025851F8B|nr:uncharacterized protein LOC130823414 [Amaranthus tricolor]
MRDEAAVSYSWVLQGLRDIFGTAQTPSVIVTDRDEGLSAAIRDVFPDVRHLLCIWHIGNDVENMVDKLCGGKKNQQGQVFRKSRWNPLVESSTIEEYEDKWQVIVRDETDEEVRYPNANDKEYFQSLVDEVLKSDPAVVRRMSQLLEYELHPDGAEIPEPYASPPRKGRPSTSKNMRRRKSSFEYSRSSSRGRGSTSSSRGRSSGRSSGRETQSSVGIKFSFNLSDDPGGRDFSHFPWPNNIPFILPPYLAQYLTLYLSQESLDDSIFRIGSHANEPAPFMHWMYAPMALYSAATFLNIAIAYYVSADCNPQYNCLILPLRKASGYEDYALE